MVKISLNKKTLNLVIEDVTPQEIFIEKEFIIDSRKNRCVLLPAAYWKILEKFPSAKKINFQPNFTLSQALREKIKLRKYQQEILQQLKENNYRGVIVLPTGSGKTFLAIATIRELYMKTLIVVPTIDLMKQWKNRIRELLGFSGVGLYGGGQKSIQEITIATYNSARKYEFLRRSIDFFGLVIFDEVHHLPAKTFRVIAQHLLAPHRIGLTATLPKDREHLQFFEKFVGPIIRGPSLDNLIAREILSDFSIKTIEVRLSPSTRERYRELITRYVDYIRSFTNEKEPKKAFSALIRKARRDLSALEALLTLKKARELALFPREKILVLNTLLRKHKQDKILIFTRSTSMANTISYLFGIPKIIHKTPPEVRYKLLEMLKNGKISKIVSSKVLEEGIDLPDVSIIIIVSGTSSDKEFIQRIGRALRYRVNKRALIYELITNLKYEKKISRKRKNIIFETF
ncbi:MAG: DEAD/DEAH box helicase [Candidatus Njordarchaeales archaeon]